MDNVSDSDDIEQAELERWFYSEGMFVKDTKAAGEYLLEVSNILLEGKEIPPVLRVSLGLALREAAIVALDKGNKEGGEVLLKELGLKKGGSDRKLIQAARAGAKNGELAVRFNVGKNEVPKKLKTIKDKELELLNRRLSHTVGRLLRMLDEMEDGAPINEISDLLKKYLISQNMLVSMDDIESHIQDVFRLAREEKLIIVRSPSIFRNPDKLP